MSTKIGKKEFKSIINGYTQLTANQQKLFKAEFQYKLVANSDSAWRKKFKGQIGYSPAEIEVVEALFRNFGVIQNIWSDPIQKLPLGFGKL
ncbi:hypothetical protein [Chishuiella sp.]|uniref:hypothetical protein n=1 Tax=Chishuiella sp. TaxID=1969467 RepID=UPI0028AF308E|nr:hypothetical protein [Chishuiella sp.]